jgi:uncharacterized membrane protein YdjX (TVP38/TMEM64 family)
MGIMQASAQFAATGPSSWKKAALLVFFISAVAAFFYWDLDRYFTLDALKAHRDELLTFTEAHYASAVALYIAIYCLLVAVSLPGAVILTLAGGFLFGPVLATLYVNVGATTGSTLAFLSSRYLFRDWVEARFGHRLGPLQEGLSKNGFSYLLTLRLIPAVPFFLINLLAGLTRIPLSTYVLATALGIIPGAFVYAYAGQQLGTINSLSDIASPRVLLALALLGLLAVLPALYNRLRARRRRS